MAQVHEDAQRRRERILAMGPDLPTRAEVAKQVGSTLKIVTNDILLLKARGHKIDARPAAKSWIKPEIREAVRRDYASGVYIEEIVEKHGVSPAQIRNACSDIDRPDVPKHRPPQPLASYTIRTPYYISTTYAATEERAREVQEALEEGRKRWRLEREHAKKERAERVLVAPSPALTETRLSTGGA